MYKCLSIIFAALLLTSCSYLHVHKQEITQGNIITTENVSRLHRGMSQDEVEQVMGTPTLSNIFTPNRVEYVYTNQPGGKAITEKKVTCLFNRGRLVEIQEG